MHIPGKIKPYNYLGAKFSLLPWLLKMLPRTKGFIDACGGSGCVLLNKEPVPIEIYNDVNQENVNFFAVLRNKPQELLHLLHLTPHARIEYENAWDRQGDSDVERARKFYIRVMQSYFATGSQNESKGWLSSVREHRWNIAQATHHWLSGVEGLADVVDRLAMVQLECRDVCWILDKYDDRENLFYLDPPYDNEHRSGSNDYTHDFKEADHVRVRNKVEDCKGLVAVSGYDSAFMRELYKDWHCYPGPLRRNTMSDREVRECLWTNYNISKLWTGRLF